MIGLFGSEKGGDDRILKTVEVEAEVDFSKPITIINKNRKGGRI